MPKLIDAESLDRWLTRLCRAALRPLAKWVMKDDIFENELLFAYINHQLMAFHKAADGKVYWSLRTSALPPAVATGQSHYPSFVEAVWWNMENGHGGTRYGDVAELRRRMKKEAKDG